MYELFATKNGKYVRFQRAGSRANKAAQTLRDAGWNVSIKALSGIAASIRLG